jgi:N-methylhydantoinase B
VTDRLDPITLEVIQNALSSIADELALVIMRAAYSNIVRDSMDYSTAVCDRHGQTIAQGLTTPVHLGSFPDAMRNLLAKYQGDIADGDVFIFNDPYGSGGMHLPDFYVVRPVFVDGELEGFAATLAHQQDVGGIAPGGMAVYATEIQQEGLRIPTLKLYEAGRPNGAIFALIERNTRSPVNVMGDLRSQIAACATGTRAIERMVRRYGSAEFRRYAEALHDHAERMIRAEIAKLPRGTWTFEDFVDGLGDRPTPIRFKVALTVSGDGIDIDWNGTSAQVEAAINGPMPTTRAMSYLAVRCAIGGSIPNCEGYMRAITVRAPEGSVANPRNDAACGARGIICFRMFDTLMGAFAQIVPERIPAANEGGSNNPHIAGRDRNGKRFLVSGGLMGCWGGSAMHDGQEGISNPAANLGNTPVELLESRHPVEITRYAFVQNSGGPGRARGGAALVRGYRLLADKAVLVMRSDRRDHLPYGLAGGRPGTPSWNVLNPGPNQRTLAVCPMSAVPMVGGDEFVHIQAGAGGYGDPLDRDPEKVRADIENELITPSYGEAVYGVILRASRVDLDGTERKRAEMRAATARPDASLDLFYQTIGIPRP